MQVNFNPSVNYSRPNFKASFSDDIDTKSVIKSFACRDFGSLDILTAHLALKDIDSDDKIKLYYEDHYNETLYAENSKGKKIIIEEIFDLLNAIFDKKLINKAPKGDSRAYFNKANEILRKECETEEEKITDLKKEMQTLTTRLSNLKTVLSNTERNLEHKRVNLIKEQIFSLAKKVK